MNPSCRFRLQLAGAWFLAGLMLALLLPVSPQQPALGWTGLYWCLGAPLTLLLLPCLQWRGSQQPRVQAVRR